MRLKKKQRATMSNLKCCIYMIMIMMIVIYGLKYEFSLISDNKFLISLSIILFVIIKYKFYKVFYTLCTRHIIVL